MALHKPEHKKWWYWASWPILVIVYIAAMPVAMMMGRHEEPKGEGTIKKWDWEEYRALEDWIDDPIDWLKQKLFGIGESP